MPAGQQSTEATGCGRVLELVRTGSAVTQQELIVQSGFSRAKVADRLGRLEAAGLIEGAARDSTGGRPAIAYALAPGPGRLLVADLGATAGRFACLDLHRRVLAERRVELDIAAGPDPVLGLVAEQLRGVLHEAGSHPDQVIGTAVGVPGPVEVAAGRVISPPIMTGWDGVAIPEALRLGFETPVLVDNDVNLMVLGEQRVVRPADRDLMFVKVGAGVGSGIVADGKLQRGVDGAAGDIGHIRGPGVDRVCRCGMRGCVEAVGGGWAVARDLREGGRDVPGAAAVAELLRVRDPDALELLHAAGEVLGEAIAHAVALLNPATVVLGGEIAAADERLLARIREVVYARASPLATRRLSLVPSELGEQAGVLGGAELVLDSVLAPGAVDRRLTAIP